MSMGKDLIEEKFVEDGASLEHERWARWQKYMFSKGTVDSDGIFHLPKEFVDRWFRQIDTPYSELSESEKESDRKETRNYLPLLLEEKKALLYTIKSEVVGMKYKVPHQECNNGKREPCDNCIAVQIVNDRINSIIELIEKHQNEG